MFTRRTFAGLAGILAGTLQTASAQAQTGARRAEVEALRRFAETTHPRGREAGADADWRSRWDTLAVEADSLSDGRYFLRLRRALSWFEDGHTTVLPFAFTGGIPSQMASGPFALSLSWRVRVFHDGAYVVEARDEAASLNGARITRVGGMEAGAIARAVAEQWPGNDAWAQRWAGYHFGQPALLEALAAINDPRAPIEVEAQLGRRRVRTRLLPRPGAGSELVALQREQAQCERWAAEVGAANFTREAGDALYVSVTEMEDLESFAAFTRSCFAAMDDSTSQRLIVDLRRNGGGNNFLPEALRKRIGHSRFNRPGGLYVLTSPATFSAAQNLVTRLERETFATFVGEPTGGRPNHYGDAASHVGSATGITSIVSAVTWSDSYPSDQRDWTMPDLFAPITFADWRAGRDAALDAAMTHQVGAGAGDEWDQDRVFYYDRASQMAEWRPFWRAGA